MKIFKQQVEQFNLLVSKHLQSKAFLDIDEELDKKFLYLKAISIDNLAKLQYLKIDKKFNIDYNIPPFNLPINIFFIMPKDYNVNEEFTFQMEQNIESIFSKIFFIYKKKCN